MLKHAVYKKKLIGQNFRIADFEIMTRTIKFIPTRKLSEVRAKILYSISIV
jgi:hypothetical protein